MGEVFKVRFIKALMEILALSLWGLLRSSFEPCCNFLTGENMKGNHYVHLVRIYGHPKGRHLINRRTVFLLLFGLVLGMAWSAQGAIFLEDDFDDSVLDPAWTITLNNVSDWTYEESGMNLTVTDITSTVGDPVWGKAILSRALPADQTDFSVDFEFSWIAEEGPSTYQALYITLYGSGGEIIAFTGYLSTLGSFGQKVVVVTKGDANVNHDHWGADYQPDSNYYASYTLPQSGSASIRITKVEDTIQFFWDNTLLLAPQVTSPLHGIDIQFWYKDVAVHGQSFGTESVDLVRVREAYYPGDVTGDKNVDVIDVVKSLQITAGILPTENISLASDVIGDNRIGLEEALYGLRELSGEPRPAIVDRSDISFEDNLLAKVQAGEWTLGEGLVATLKLMVGELDAESVLRYPELLSYDGTSILAMANEYLEDGSDAEAKVEIARLLSFLVFSNEQLEAMTGITAASTLQQSQEMTGITAAPTAQQVEIATSGSVLDCKFYFQYSGEEIPQGVGDCLQVRSTQMGHALYNVYAPAPSFPDVGWENKPYYDWALEAMKDAVPKFVDLFIEVGRPRPPISVIFTVIKKPYAKVSTIAQLDKPCGIFVYTGIQDAPEDYFKWLIAGGVAMCFETKMFAGPNKPYAEGWWYSGLARHLGNVVYPYTNYEWGPPPDKRAWLNKLAQIELSTSLYDRRGENFLFFQYLENIKGNKAFINLIRSMYPIGSRAEQETKLAAYPGMENFFHDFAKALTDQKVMDTSGAVIPYPLNEWNCPTLKVDKPFDFGRILFKPLKVGRDCLVIEEDKVADLNFREPNGTVRKSMRPTYESDISWTEVPSTFGLPDKDCNREVTMVVTTTAPDKRYELSSLKVVDAPCTIEGVWVVDNSSLWLKPWDFTLVSIDGEIRATFHKKNNNVDVVYDNWEYIVHRMGTGVLGDVELYFYEKITRTINAQGTTTYTLGGDTINFGHSWESDFMTGTETIHHIKEWAPKGYIPDTNETIVQTPDWTYRDIFTSFPNYELGGILRLFPYIWSSKECILTRIGPAPDDE